MATNENTPVTRKDMRQMTETMKKKQKITPLPKTRTSPLNTHMREMQAAAFKRAQEQKVQRQMEQNHLKGGNVWDNGYTN